MSTHRVSRPLARSKRSPSTADRSGRAERAARADGSEIARVLRAARAVRKTDAPATALRALVAQARELVEAEETLAYLGREQVDGIVTGSLGEKLSGAALAKTVELALGLRGPRIAVGADLREGGPFAI